MNLVIPYRFVETPELKYALRSIEKYLTGYDKIFLVGDRLPNWIQNVELIYCSEESVKCAKNILNKLVTASNHPGVGGQFLQWQDDIFLQQHLNVNDTKYWYEGSLGTALDKAFGRYRKIIEHTALKITGDAKFYDTHTPIVYDGQALREIEPIWNGKDYLIKSMYCHHFFYENSEEWFFMEDCKIDIPQPKEKILETIKGKLFFSISSEFEPIIEDVLNGLYPEKSKYEK